MVFAIISVLAILGILFRQTAFRYHDPRVPAAAGQTRRFDWGGYGAWLTGRTKSAFRVQTVHKTCAAFESWSARYYPGWTKWLLAAFALSFLYLAGSGFFFAVFIPRGIYGLPLVGHVVLGGLFAVLLAGLLVGRARDYRFDKQEEAVFERFACPVFKNLTKAFVRKVLFWTFAVCGLVIILTALLSLLPVLPAEAQHTLIGFHRYAALLSLLAAIVFVDITFIPETRP